MEPSLKGLREDVGVALGRGVEDRILWLWTSSALLNVILCSVTLILAVHRERVLRDVVWKLSLSFVLVSSGFVEVLLGVVRSSARVSFGGASAGWWASQRGRFRDRIPQKYQSRKLELGILIHEVAIPKNLS